MTIQCLYQTFKEYYDEEINDYDMKIDPLRRFSVERF